MVTGTAGLAVFLWTRGQVEVGTVAMALPMSWQIVSISGWVAWQVTNIFENIGVVQEGIEMTRVGGRYLWMGNIVPDMKAEIVPHDAVRQPKLIRGVLAYDRWVIPRALDWLARAQQRYPFERLVSETYPLEQINEAFGQAEWNAGKGQVGRIGISLSRQP